MNCTNNNTTNVTHKFFKVRASALNDNQVRINGVGHVCLVLKPVKNSSKFRVAVSFKSPADKANPVLGTRIAEGRLNSRRAGRNFVVSARSISDATNKALTEMFTKTRRVFRRGHLQRRPFVPDWLFKAVVEKERSLVSIKS